MTEARSQVHKFASSKVPGPEPVNLRTLEPANHASSLGLEEARTLVASPLWPRICAFLWDFASLCDPARLAAALALPETGSPSPESAAARAVSGDPSPESEAARAVAGHTWPASPRLARAAEQALGVSPFFHSFPSTDASRLLLLSREDYDRLAQFLGTVALAPALRRITAGSEVRALKAALPGVYPEALTFAAYFHKHETLFKKVAPADAAANAETICAAGHSILAAALSDLPPELLLRQRLRFPAGSPADAAFAREAGSVPEASASGAAARLALKLSNPTEYSTLCS